MNPVAEAEERAHEERHLTALKANYPDEIANIQAKWRAGVPRKRLIGWFGQDLVDLAIADLVS